MKIDDVIVNIDPTIATEDDLKNFVANSKLQFPLGKLSKIVITANKNVFAKKSQLFRCLIFSKRMQHFQNLKCFFDGNISKNH